MERLVRILIVFLFSLLFYGVYSTNPHLVDVTAYACLGICYGHLAYKIANWLHRVTTKNKKEEK